MMQGQAQDLQRERFLRYSLCRRIKGFTEQIHKEYVIIHANKQKRSYYICSPPTLAPQFWERSSHRVWSSASPLPSCLPHRLYCNKMCRAFCVVLTHRRCYTLANKFLWQKQLNSKSRLVFIAKAVLISRLP